MKKLIFENRARKSHAILKIFFLFEILKKIDAGAPFKNRVRKSRSFFENRVRFLKITRENGVRFLKIARENHTRFWKILFLNFWRKKIDAGAPFKNRVRFFKNCVRKSRAILKQNIVLKFWKKIDAGLLIWSNIDGFLKFLGLKWLAFYWQQLWIAKQSLKMGSN